MKYKVGIIGHFGFGLDLANGQTIKTKIVSDVINKAVQGSVCYVDAHGGLKAVFPVAWGCLKLLKQCDNVFIFLTENGLKVALPLLANLNRLFHKKLHYSVIGGWLPSFLQKNTWLIKHLVRFDYVYAETDTMKQALERLGVYNCVVIPNCKELKIVGVNETPTRYERPFQLCTFSRVMKEKGIEDIINVVKNINEAQGSVVYHLHIFGQVDEGQKEWFKHLSDQFPEYIEYGGVIPFSESVNVLKEYFALVFPTRFLTEGVPGTIVDAYASGIPVVSSRWESFNDVVDEGVTGYGYEFGNIDDLERVLTDIANEPERVTDLKANCIKKAKDYSLERLESDLLKYIS